MIWSKTSHFLKKLPTNGAKHKIESGKLWPDLVAGGIVGATAMGVTAAAAGGGACPTPEIPVKPTPSGGGGCCWTAVRVGKEEVEVATAAAATLFI